MTQTVGATKTLACCHRAETRSARSWGCCCVRWARRIRSWSLSWGMVCNLRREEVCIFCPADADLKDRETLISLNQVYKDLEKCPAAVKLLLVDACRNDPLSNLGKSRRVVELETVSTVPAARSARRDRSLL